MSLRYIYRLIQAFVKRFKAIIFLGVILGIISFLFLTFLLPDIVSTKIKIGIVGRYTVDKLPEVISAKISGGLTKIDESGNVIPNIARSWETLDGGKTWIFNLDQNIVWQDGKTITSNEINYEFNDAVIEKPTTDQIKFILDSQFSAFPIILTKPLYKKGLLGVGEYKVKNISLTGGYVQNITLINNKKDKLIYKFYPTEDRLILGFKLGEIDVIDKLQDISKFENWDKIKIDQDIGWNNFVGIFLNTENEKLSEKTIRQGLNYSINKTEMGERALGPISPFSWGFNPQVKPYEQDKEKIKEIKNLEIKLSTLPNLLKTAEKIAKDWQEAGVKTEIEVITSVPVDYDAFLATVDIPKDPDQYSLWHSTQATTNISKYKNPRIDKLLEDGRTELDQDTRKKIYLDFQRFLVEDVPAIFLYHPIFYTISRY
ncbi:MAG: ABC transporter substrate-binding protein [Patescibacteria group bacterium]